MANPNFADNGLDNAPKQSVSKPRAKGAKSSMDMKTAGWGGLPGNKQPRDRSGGTKRVKAYPKAEGL